MSIEGARSAEHRIGDIHDELRRLTERVDALTARMDALPPSLPALPQAQQMAVAPPAPPQWSGQSRLLQRLAMISFVLVVALLLRTLSDSGSIAMDVGVALGAGYATLLIALGALLLARGRRGRRVLPVCGSLLLCAVVIEAHQSFGMLTAGTAQGILLADLVVLSWLGLRSGVGTVLALPVLATVSSALVLDFPDLLFVPTALLLLTANAIAHLARRRLQLPWLGWLLFFATMFFWLLWAMKARAAWLHAEPATSRLQVEWLLPLLGAFVLLYLLQAIRRSFADPDDPGGFGLFLPTANVLFGLATASTAIGASAAGLGGIAVAVAALHFAIAGQLVRRRHHGNVAATAFTLAAATASVLAAPLVLDDLGLVAPVWAMLALGLMVLAAQWSSPGLRITSWLLQGAALVAAVSGQLYTVPAAALPRSLLGATAISVLAIVHYGCSRRRPAAGTWLARLDRNDHGSIVLLWLAAANAFGLLRLCIHSGLVLLGTELPKTFQCAQSVLLNVASIGLMLAGMHWRSKQMLLTAVLAAACGGLRVFGADLLETSGVPLVLSVFSWGMAAAIGSLVLGRLQAQRTAAN